MYDLGCQTCQ